MLLNNLCFSLIHYTFPNFLFQDESVTPSCSNKECECPCHEQPEYHYCANQLLDNTYVLNCVIRFAQSRSSLYKGIKWESCFGFVVMSALDFKGKVVPHFCFSAMCNELPDSLLVCHLLTSWWPVWQSSRFLTSYLHTKSVFESA